MATDGSGPPLLKRIPSGVPGLDAVLRGGFLRGGVFIVQGSPGAGKTILGNQICFRHVAAGGRALYTTLLAENHARMLLHIGQLGFRRKSDSRPSLFYQRVSGARGGRVGWRAVFAAPRGTEGPRLGNQFRFARVY